MLRHLYKTLIISIMCGSLSIMNMTAFAQEAGAQGSTSTTTKAKPTNAVTRDANGVYKKTDKHSFSKIEDADMLASITMLAVGTIAGRALVSYKPMTTDLMVAGAGGAAFMVGEIMSNVAYKKKMDDMTVEITKSSDGQKDQAQIQRLEDLKKSYEEAKKTTNTKKMLQTAAAAAFAGAAAMAAWAAYTEYSLFLKCMTALKTQSPLVKACPESKASTLAAPAAAALEAACQSCTVGLDGLLMQMQTINVERQSPGPSMVEKGTIFPKQTAAKAYLSGICKAPSTSSEAAILKVTPLCLAALEAESVNQIYGYKPTVTYNENNLLNKILFPVQAPKFSYEIMQSRDLSSSVLVEKLFDLILPKAEAGWLPLLGLGASTAATYFLITGTLATTVDMQMFVPFNRAIAFGGLAVLSFLAVKSSDNQIKKIDKNISDIDKILTEMNALASGIKTNTIQERQIHMAGFNTSNHADVQLSTNPSVKTDCITSNSSSNCTSLTNELKAMPDFANLPDSFKGIASQAAKLGDGLSGTNVISGSTLSTAANLANKANAISKAQKSVQAKLNGLYGANRQVDFDKAEKNLIGKWNEQTAKALRSKDTSAGSFLGSIGMSPIASPDSKTAAVAPAPGKKPVTFGTGSNSAPGTGPAKEKDFELDFKEEGVAEAGFASTGDGSAATKDEVYDIGQNDINTNSNESIFQMISNRYIKSGYPKLLEEEPVKN